MEIRLIKSGAGSAAYNMALDEALMRLATKPTLRLYSWKRAAVSLGCFQPIGDIDSRFCKKKGIEVVRRITGGKAVLHDKELTYSFVADEQMMPESVIESYKIISTPVLNALSSLGINACFKDSLASKTKSPACLSNPSWYEILAGGRKIAAASQKRHEGKVLQHGSILLLVDHAMQADILKRKGKALAENIRSRVGALSMFNPVEEKKLAGEIARQFGISFDAKITESEATKQEAWLACELMETRYKSKEWNLGR